MTAVKSIAVISTFSLIYNLDLGFYKTSLLFGFCFALGFLKLSAVSGFLYKQQSPTRSMKYTHVLLKFFIISKVSLRHATSENE